MHSEWITYQGQKIFLQDFSNHQLTDVEGVKEELAAVQEIVLHQPQNSVLVLADFRDTHVGGELLDLMIASSKITKNNVRKTAVLGVVGAKRILADMLMGLTGQQLTLFDDAEKAKDWLAQ